MNASTVIDKVNRFKPNALQELDVIDMINELEGDIAINVLGVAFTPITQETKNEELLAVAPYEKIYTDFVMARIDQLNGDIEMYSLTGNQFNVNFRAYKAYCIREGLTKGFTGIRKDYF